MNDANYDSWRTAYPDHWDHEYELNGIIEGEEADVHFENRTFYAQLTVEFSDDKVEGVEIESLVAVDEDDNEHEFKQEDFKYYIHLFQTTEIKDKLIADNQENERVLVRVR